MALPLYAHPFSSYCQKVLIALYENDTPFAYRHLEHDGVAAERAALWPFGQFPILTDDGAVIAESSIIIEHLDLHHRGAARLMPDDPAEALQVRFLDRFFDNHVMNVMQRPVAEALRPEIDRLDETLAEARRKLEIAYEWLEARLAGREWAAGGAFGMADCAAAPALFYADWVHPIGECFAVLKAYRARLLARPSFARAIEEARPYRAYFPLSAPDRD